MTPEDALIEDLLRRCVFDKSGYCVTHKSWRHPTIRGPLCQYVLRTSRGE